MDLQDVEFRDGRELPRADVLRLYQACGWSAAAKPDQLVAALAGSHALVSAWHRGSLVGLGNAISDGALVVYYPHLLVLPVYQRCGLGREIMRRLGARYAGFHQQVLLAVLDAVPFYERQGFSSARSVEPMWIYDDIDHSRTAEDEGT